MDHLLFAAEETTDIFDLLLGVMAGTSVALLLATLLLSQPTIRRNFRRVVRAFGITLPVKTPVARLRDEEIKRLQNLARLASRHAGTLDTRAQPDDDRLNVIEARVEALEDRIPADSIIDKVASINDAVLAKALENLEQRVKNVEESQLSKWDVAQVILILLGGMSTIVAIGLAVLGD